MFLGVGGGAFAAVDSRIAARLRRDDSLFLRIHSQFTATLLEPKQIKHVRVHISITETKKKSNSEGNFLLNWKNRENQWYGHSQLLKFNLVLLFKMGFPVFMYTLYNLIRLTKFITLIIYNIAYVWTSHNWNKKFIFYIFFHLHWYL